MIVSTIPPRPVPTLRPLATVGNLASSSTSSITISPVSPSNILPGGGGTHSAFKPIFPSTSDAFFVSALNSFILSTDEDTLGEKNRCTPSIDGMFMVQKFLGHFL